MKRYLITGISAALILSFLVSATMCFEIMKPEYDSRMDVNQDGIIDMKDVVALILKYGTRGEPTTWCLVPDPGPYPGRPPTVPASRYYITGGQDPNHDLEGVDSHIDTTIPNPDPDWGPTWSAYMWHTSDFVVYHFVVEERIYEVIRVCMRNTKTPASGTPVDVWAWTGAVGTVPTVSHDIDISLNPGPPWIPIGATASINPPGTWAIYTFPGLWVLGPRSEFYIAIRLQNGEYLDLPPGQDRNVDVAWVQIA